MNVTRRHPSDIKPLIKSADGRIFYDEDCLIEAGYARQGTLRDMESQIKGGLTGPVKAFAHMFPVWVKGDKIIFLIEHEPGTFEFGGWVNN